MIKIDKKEVLRYLGYKGQDIDEDLNELIDNVILDAEKLKYKSIYKRFTIVKGDSIKVLETNLELSSFSINNILKYSDEIIIFATTLGSEIEKKMNSLKYTNLTEMMIWDACASEMIEKILDELEVEIQEVTNKYLSHRFSPGYGDFSLTYQKPILKILEASKKIGVMTGDSLVLMPKKSVTGIIGLQEDSIKADYYPCDDCLMRNNCDFTKCSKGVLNEV